jgi:Zn-dependent protease with chaperone function
MDFFTHQESARRKTGILLTYLMLAVSGITFAIYAVIRFFMVYSDLESLKKEPFIIPEVLGGVSILVVLLVGIGALYKLAVLRGGGSGIAKSLGGRLVPSHTQDPDERKVLNLVEEMAIASGLAPPPVYILPEENSINAFAAGYRPETAVVALTRGAIRALSRDELQGVIAHEFSHILNGDMRLNIRLIGLLHGVLLIALLGRQLMRGRARSKDDGPSIALLGLCLLIIGQVGVLFGHLIKSAVSRQREFLADASAVQFTRLPDGLCGALKKIGGLSKGSLIRHPRAEEASHMYFSNGLRRHAISPMATHPPLKVRVSRLDPQFKGVFTELSPAVLFAPPARRGESSNRIDENELLEKLPPTLRPLPVGGAGVPVIFGSGLKGNAAEGALDSVGNPTQAHLQTARKILETLPPPIREAAASPDGSRALIFAQLMRYSGDAREAMTDFLKKHLDPALFDLVSGYETELSSLSAGLFLPLAELCIPGLRGIERAAYHQFKRQVQVLVELDRSITLFEFALGNILFRSLDVHFDGDDREPFRYYSLKAVLPHASVLLTAMARLGQPDEDSALLAFHCAQENGPKGSRDLTFLPPDESRLRNVQESLDAMNVLAYPVRRQILKLCLNCLLQDGHIHFQEAELFRAIAAALGCPVPVWLLGEGSTE